MNGKEFIGFKGGQIGIDTKNKILYFSGIDRIKGNVDPNKYTKEQFDKGKLKEYKNPKIIKENGKTI